MAKKKAINGDAKPRVPNLESNVRLGRIPWPNAKIRVVTIDEFRKISARGLNDACLQFFLRNKKLIPPDWADKGVILFPGTIYIDDGYSMCPCLAVEEGDWFRWESNAPNGGYQSWHRIAVLED